MPLLKLKKFLKRSSRGLGFAYPSYLSLKMFKLKLKKPAKSSSTGLDSDSTTPPPLSKNPNLGLFKAWQCHKGSRVLLQR